MSTEARLDVCASYELTWFLKTSAHLEHKNMFSFGFFVFSGGLGLHSAAISLIS